MTGLGPPTSLRAFHRRLKTLRLTGVLAMLALTVAAFAASAAQAQPSVLVMTQNLYQGTEFRHFASLQGHTPTQEEAILATTLDYQTYQLTRFKDRAQELAQEIARRGPALLGLQEVATWHLGAFNPAHPFALPGPVSEDFTEELIADLAARGKQYAVVSRHNNNFTLAFPISTPGGLVSVGMVESGEILARTDLTPQQLQVANPQSGAYNAKIPTIPNPLVPSEPFEFSNSWQSIDATVHGKTFRFITTHLDALAPGGVVSGPQAEELLAGPANTSLPVVLGGDMNSGPQVAPAAYNAFVSGGLSDTWTSAGLGAPPLTCCHLAPSDVSADPHATYTEDPDHIFTRGNFSVIREHLVGDKRSAFSPVGGGFIWPSDHAGMIARLGLGSL
jgi:hypothetical protein